MAPGEAVGEFPRTLRVVVAGVPMDGPSAEYLRAEARLFGVDQRIDFIESPGWTKRSIVLVSDLLRKACLFCGMSHKEGFLHRSC